MSTDSQPSSRDRFLAMIRGNPDGSRGQRIRYYLSRIVAGAVAGFFVVAMSASTRGGQHTSLALDFYYWGAAIGAAVAIVLVTIPRLIRPKDWPTPDELRRGVAPHDGDKSP